MTTFDTSAIALAIVIIVWFVGTLSLFLKANSSNQSGILFSGISIAFLIVVILIFKPLYHSAGGGTAVILGLIISNVAWPIFLVKDTKRQKEYVERRRRTPVHMIREHEPEPWDGPVIPEDPFQGDERLRAMFEKDEWFALMQEIKKYHKAAESMGDKASMFKYEYMKKWATEERDRRAYEKKCSEEK